MCGFRNYYYFYLNVQQCVTRTMQRNQAFYVRREIIDHICKDDTKKSSICLQEIFISLQGFDWSMPRH